MAKILLIEDSRALLVLLKKVLADAGHHVVAACSGAAGVRRLKSTDVDLVLTDLYMPPPDGFEIVSAVRALRPHTPLVVMSANSLACDVFASAEALGAIATLEKPFSNRKLLQVIDAALARRPPGIASSSSRDRVAVTQQ